MSDVIYRDPTDAEIEEAVTHYCVLRQLKVGEDEETLLFDLKGDAIHWLKAWLMVTEKEETGENA